MNIFDLEGIPGDRVIDCAGACWDEPGGDSLNDMELAKTSTGLGGEKVHVYLSRDALLAFIRDPSRMNGERSHLDARSYWDVGACVGSSKLPEGAAMMIDSDEEPDTRFLFVNTKKAT